MLKQLIISLIVCICFLFSATLKGSVNIEQKPMVADGVASWYGYEAPNRHTANGEKWNPEGMTAAMPDKKWMNKLIRITNIDNGKSIVIRVNDYGPSKAMVKLGRVIDVSRGVSKIIGIYSTGTGKVHVEEILD